MGTVVVVAATNASSNSAEPITSRRRRLTTRTVPSDLKHACVRRLMAASSLSSPRELISTISI